MPKSISDETLDKLFVIVSHPDREERLPLAKITPLDDPHTTMAIYSKDDPYRDVMNHCR